MNNDIEYPPKQPSKHQCTLCNRVLPTIPFTGIGWRDVALKPPSKYRSRICNECYKEWRKTHPASKRELNVELINKIISVLYIIYALYGLISFMQYGVGNWSSFLAGPGLILLIAFIFTHLVYGLINKKIEFVPQNPTQEKRKWEFSPPQPFNVQTPFRRKQEIPNTLNYAKCDICHVEMAEEDLFEHPNGTKICLDCIKRGKRDE